MLPSLGAPFLVMNLDRPYYLAEALKLKHAISIGLLARLLASALGRARSSLLGKFYCDSFPA